MGCLLVVVALALILGLGAIDTPGGMALLLAVTGTVGVWLVAFRSGWNGAVNAREEEDKAAVTGRAERDRR